jgi:hypothetical protein
MAQTEQISILASEDCKLNDSVKLRFGTGSSPNTPTTGDISMAWDGTDFDILQTTANSAINVGVDGAGLDFKLYGDTASAYLLWDQSADDLIFAGAAGLVFGDDAFLKFGASDDVTIEWDTAAVPDQLIMLPAADNTIWTIGSGTLGFDLKIFGGNTATWCYWDADGGSATTGKWEFGQDAEGVDVAFYATATGDYILFDESASVLQFEDVAVLLMDDTALKFGDSSDVTIDWNAGGGLDVLAAANNSVIAFGNGTNSFDIKVFGATTADYLIWDASDNRLESAGVASIQIGESTTGVNSATPNAMIYGYYFGKTTALTGTARGVRGNGRITVASAAGTVHGVEGAAGNGSSASADDGINLGTGRGGYFFYAGTGKAGAVPTVTTAAGVAAQLDIDAANLTVTTAHGAHINVQTGSAANNTVTNLYGVTIDHEAVDGAAKTMAAYLYLRAVNGNEPATNAISLATGANLTNLIYIPTATGPFSTGSLTNSAAGDVQCDARIKIAIGATPYYIPLFDTAA